MFTLSPEEHQLMQSLPLIKRARGGYLYTPKGERFYDLFMNHGTYLSGHHPAGLALAFKNPLEQGLSMPYPNVWQDRLFKLILKIIHLAQSVSYYDEITPFLQALSQPHIAEPWDISETASIGYLRPHCPIPTHWHYGVMAIAPSLGGGAIIINLSDEKLPPSHIMPAYLARAVLRSLKAFTQPAPCVNSINLNGRNFTITQNYIRYIGLKENYPALHHTALHRNIWLAPTANHTGLFLPHLFSEKQQELIISFLSS